MNTGCRKNVGAVMVFFFLRLSQNGLKMDCFNLLKPSGNFTYHQV
jgi:hypothetical protein